MTQPGTLRFVIGSDQHYPETTDPVQRWQEVVRLFNQLPEPVRKKITLKDGKVLSGRAELAKGSPANPMSYAEVADKFRGCAEFTKWPTAKTEAVIAAVKALESLADLGKLTAALTA